MITLKETYNNDILSALYNVQEFCKELFDDEADRHTLEMLLDFIDEEGSYQCDRD